MSFTFIKALGGRIGDSICEDDKMSLALSIIEKAEEENVETVFCLLTWFAQTTFLIQQTQKYAKLTRSLMDGKGWTLGQNL